MKKYFLTIVMTICMMLVDLPASAEQAAYAANQPKSLTVHYYVQNMGEEVPISGAEVGIFKVAQLEL